MEYNDRPMTLCECMDSEDQVHSYLQGTVRDLVAACEAKDKVIKCLRKGLRQCASECAECEGTGKLRGEHGFEEVCPECADIRKLLHLAGG